MFSVPAFSGRTANARNDHRIKSLGDKIGQAESDLNDALSRLTQMREAFDNLTEEDMAALTVGQVQNLANTTGHFVTQVQRSIGRVHESLVETVVVGSGFEAVQ